MTPAVVEKLGLLRRDCLIDTITAQSHFVGAITPDLSRFGASSIRLAAGPSVTARTATPPTIGPIANVTNARLKECVY